MNSNFPPIPLTCEGHDNTALHLSKCTSPNVVEPTATSGPRLYFDQLPSGIENVDAAFSVNDHGATRHHHDERPIDDDDHVSAINTATDVVATQSEFSRHELRQRDRLDREVDRALRQRERLELRARRNARSHDTKRRRAPQRTRHVDPAGNTGDRGAVGVPSVHSKRHVKRRAYFKSGVPTRDSPSDNGGLTDVATHSNSLKTFSSGPLHGCALAIYFILLPYVVLTKWRFTSHEANGTLIRTLLIALALFWVAFIVQMVHNVVLLRRGQFLSSNGSAWLAGLMVAALPFLLGGSAQGATFHHPVSISASLHQRINNQEESTREHHAQPPLGPQNLNDLSLVPFALMAKRRYDELRQHDVETSEHDVDATIDELRAYNPLLLAQLRTLFGFDVSGVVEIPDEMESVESSSSVTPVVACVVDTSDRGTVSFAREGGVLEVDPAWSLDVIQESCVAVHQGRVDFCSTLPELLRLLAVRSLRGALVVYLGAPSDLDDELRASCVTVVPRVRRHVTSSRTTFNLVHPQPSLSGDVRVELLRAEPRIVGLGEPFTATLRRRCTEMVAYLALHRGEPVTGDRLRTRVLRYADVDASSRTLANTASSVRRSLGATSDGPRLHAVTSSGLYETHGVSSDVEMFHTLVGRARQVSTHHGAPFAHEALQLVQGEPLASALRGFEWFLVEGYLTRLQRDGEWAALVVHHQALLDEKFELAFWSLRQGLLLDPYSDALAEALARVPRLREFGGDRRSRAQYQSVRANGAVAMGWSFNSLGNQVTQ